MFVWDFHQFQHLVIFRPSVHLIGYVTIYYKFLQKEYFFITSTLNKKVKFVTTQKLIKGLIIDVYNIEKIKLLHGFKDQTPEILNFPLLDTGSIALSMSTIPQKQ